MYIGTEFGRGSIIIVHNFYCISVSFIFVHILEISGMLLGTLSLVFFLLFLLTVVFIIVLFVTL